ncbi:MAG: class I SAM-dependent methyltransferase, partial [Bacteroidia bacterium]|nr:class I SAM-dependent methyltransferase [Bacteroidia bacterium]
SGTHSLILQERGLDVTALDKSPGAVTCCQKQGIRKVVQSEVLEYTGSSFDTILLLMNGIGIAGNLNQLNTYLFHLKELLKPGGQILLDSSDIRYMFDQDKLGGPVLPKGGYYGDILFALYYEGEYEPSFPWVYVDFNTLEEIAHQCGFIAEKVLDGPHFDYLARLTPN